MAHDRAGSKEPESPPLPGYHQNERKALSYRVGRFRLSKDFVTLSFPPPRNAAALRLPDLDVS